MSPAGGIAGADSGAPRPARARNGLDVAFFAFVILGIWLSWQVIREMVIQRAPVEAALRLAPASPRLLARAAEAELAAGRTENALWLARRSTQAAPFSVTALRVAGLAQAELNAAEAADDLMTLAGNWSLRDDRAHAWLVERRLRQGDYGSALAHADTLARRRPERLDTIFPLFTAAGAADGRGLAALAARLEARPPWRTAYLRELSRSAEGLVLSANLAAALSQGAGRYDDHEIGGLYVRLMTAGHHEVVRRLRRAVAGDAPTPLLADGGFSGPTDRGPFTWSLHHRPGVMAEIAPSPEGSDLGLHVVHDTYSAGAVAVQTLLLPPGDYRLSGRAYLMEGDAARLAWRVACEDGARLAQVQAASKPAGRWTTFGVDLAVPRQGCPVQRLILAPDPGDRRRTLDLWFDDLSIAAR